MPISMKNEKAHEFDDREDEHLAREVHLLHEVAVADERPHPPVTQFARKFHGSRPQSR